MSHISDHNSLFDALEAAREMTLEPLSLDVDGREMSPEVILRALDAMVSEERKRRIEEVLDGRTRTVATVVEGTINIGNVSAMMRTAEALGFFELHLVTGEARYKTSPRTTTGAEKWLDVHAWDSPARCAVALKAAGYRILVYPLDTSASGIVASALTSTVEL